MELTTADGSGAAKPGLGSRTQTASLDAQSSGRLASGPAVTAHWPANAEPKGKMASKSGSSSSSSSSSSTPHPPLPSSHSVAQLRKKKVLV
ncbi:hypothetical protein EYF80_018365 [Liparis tanakae]|uniref:Uncharacterized protein n=1 Tax=Liparis tanakae TaxID=230148 RepID=A0A4Z2I058_9TELE|nr:hypothetical protein EYF80_018365 [Liparis tanakae]